MEYSLSRSSFITNTIEKLEKNYLPESDLGEGQYGKVLLCKHKLTSELYAIKHIKKSAIKHPERLKNEVSILVSCDHPNIIKIFEIFDDRKNLYIVMEQCKGGDLLDYVLKSKKIPEAEAVGLFKQIMMALNYLHKNNIVHRDLKPENIMLTDTNQVKVIDFGISKIVKPDELMNSRAGTVMII